MTNMALLVAGDECSRLRERVCGEYLEMPGLRLTVAQACRLWDVDPLLGASVLDQLVEEAFLTRSDGMYHRLNIGRHAA